MLYYFQVYSKWFSYTYTYIYYLFRFFFHIVCYKVLSRLPFTIQQVTFFIYGCTLSHFSHVRLCSTLWTVACQAPLSMGFSRQAYWSGLPCPPPGDLLNPGVEPESLKPSVYIFIYKSVYMLIQAFSFTSLYHVSPLVTINLFSMSVSLFPFVSKFICIIFQLLHKRDNHIIFVSLSDLA